ncbi:hypothetical protein DMENIID0001_134370 [Sergentomyia squamirostris]
MAVHKLIFAPIFILIFLQFVFGVFGVPTPEANPEPRPDPEAFFGGGSWSHEMDSFGSGEYYYPYQMYRGMGGMYGGYGGGYYPYGKK